MVGSVIKGEIEGWCSTLFRQRTVLIQSCVGPWNCVDGNDAPTHPYIRTGSGDLTPGYASDESSTSSSLGGGGQRASSGGKRRPKTSGARGILQRTSYWERRVEQGLLSDSSVTEEFPPLQEARAAASNGSKS